MSNSIEEKIDEILGLALHRYIKHPEHQEWYKEIVDDISALITEARIYELERAEKQKIYQGISANPKYAISGDYIADRIQELKKKQGSL